MPQHYKQKSMSQLKRDSTRPSAWCSQQKVGHSKGNVPSTPGVVCRDLPSTSKSSTDTDGDAGSSNRMCTRSVSRRLDSAPEIFRRSSSTSTIPALDVSLPRNEYHDVSPEPLGIIDPDHSSTSLERMDQTNLRSVSSPDTDMKHQDGCSDSDSIIPITRCHQYRPV